MMQQLYALWSSQPLEPKMSFQLWRSFRGDVFGLLPGLILAGGAVVVLLYWIEARKLRIRSPQDPFRPFTPLRWFGASILPGLIMGIFYAVRYRKVFPGALISPIGGAVGAALAALVGTLLVAQVLIWLPGVTPRKFLYHPRWPWRLFGRRRA